MDYSVINAVEYTPNEEIFLPREERILKDEYSQRHLESWRRNRDGYEMEDMPSILHRHGFENIFLFGRSIDEKTVFKCVQLLLNEKAVACAIPSLDEWKHLVTAEEFKVTIKVLNSICKRFGLERFRAVNLSVCYPGNDSQKPDMILASDYLIGNWKTHQAW